ncbi:MAG: response regulator transcription factor [Chloroflexi bacterium]|nr:response regulator transcription factor [Chloroflexota bacterium]
MQISRIILVAAESLPRDLLATLLDNKRYVVNTFADASAAVRHVEELGGPHLALISLIARASSGLEAARRLKSIVDMPLIFIIAPEDLPRLMGQMQVHGDDFVVSPVLPIELEARMQLLLARLPVTSYDRDRIVHFDELTIDFSRSRLLMDGKSVRISPTEAGLLHILLRNAPRVVENQTLLSRVWSQGTVAEDTLRVHMHRLRGKLEADPHNPVYIRTVRGIGYRFAVSPD